MPPSPMKAKIKKTTLIPVHLQGRGGGGMAFSCRPLPEAPSPEDGHRSPQLVEIEALAPVSRTPMDTTGLQGDLHSGQRAQDTGVWSFRCCASFGDGAG